MIQGKYSREPETALQGSESEDELSQRAADLMDATDDQLQTYQINVQSSPTAIAIRPKDFVTIENLSGNDIFIGNAQVSLNTGILLPGTGGGGANHKCVKIKGKGDIYAVSATPNSLVCVAINAEVTFLN